MSTKTKWIIGGAAAVLVLGGLGIWGLTSSSSTGTSEAQVYDLSEVQNGAIASSTLLTGTVKAKEEQYVYYESSKGSNYSLSVNVGDQVSAGQQLVQYDQTTAQANYDEAVRKENAALRDLNYYKTYGRNATTSTTADASSSTATDGDSTSSDQSATTTSSSVSAAQTEADYQKQLAAYQDAYASAQNEVSKAQDALNQNVIVSDVSGTVVEVNNNVDTSSQSSQTLVHIVSQGSLQVEGTLTEYDLANVSVGQAVNIKSKVYSDQTWTGTIASVSDYPQQSSSTSSQTSTSSGSTGSSYDYKVDITSDLGQLKQGFTVSVEVVNNKTALLVPLTAVTTEGDQSYVWVYSDATKTVKKREVTLGSADAVNQEILAGVNLGDIVLTRADSSLTDGAKVTVNADSKASSSSESSTASESSSSSETSSTESE
nr:efflux RND transporter periplasmic adaptor subunit [Streptococcus loxodontisalivarius]